MMRTIFRSKACPFDFADWRRQNVEKVFAGRACVMAITEKGKVLQRVRDEQLAARTSYWTRIRDIAISHCFEALAVGLVEDGTCMVSKGALKRCCEVTGSSFDQISDQIKDLKDNVQIAVSDAIFALDSRGKVHHIPLNRQDDYEEVRSWCHIRRIVTGCQNAVLGVTNEGTVVCAGSNCRQGPLGDLGEKLAAFENVVDASIMGYKGSLILLALSDGRVVSLDNRSSERSHWGKTPVFCSSPLLTGICVGEREFVWEAYGCNVAPKEMPKTKRVTSVAVGAEDFGSAFAVWIRKSPWGSRGA